MTTLVAGWARLFALVALVAVNTATGAAYLFERGPDCTSSCCAAAEVPTQADPCGCSLTSSPCQCSFAPAPDHPDTAIQATSSGGWHLVVAVFPQSWFNSPNALRPEPSRFWTESRGPPSSPSHQPFGPRAPPVMA